MPAAPTYTPAQQAWLNFVAKVRRGEQADPTGQYVKDGTLVPANAKVRTRPKLDAARDKYPFRLLPDGTVVLLKAAGRDGTTNQPAPPDDPPVECPPGGCVGVPVITSTFVSSEGLGGSGDIVDIKTLYGNDGLLNYAILNSNLNKGAGGSDIFYHFTRLPGSVVQGLEYGNASYLYPGLSTSDPVVAYDVKEKHWFYQSTPQANPPFAPIWYPDFGTSNDNWKPVDLNQGAGGEYVYSYQSKSLSSSNATPFHEIGIISGNSSQIQPPAGWMKMPQDLNDAAGGDYIYFCYKP